MKSYTNIEQSKKLAEILPIESADMCYRIVAYNTNDTHTYQPYCFVGTLESDIPCWSLAALLNILPYTIKLPHDIIDADGNPAYKNEYYDIYINHRRLFGDKWNIGYCVLHKRQLGKRYKKVYIDLFISKNYDNLIDVCYEMILKLHEQKLLLL